MPPALTLQNNLLAGPAYPPGLSLDLRHPIGAGQGGGGMEAVSPGSRVVPGPVAKRQPPAGHAVPSRRVQEAGGAVSLQGE